MYYLAIQNENNELLQLSDNPNYDILHMDGISSLSAKINVSDASGFDGSMFNSSKIEDRPYVLQLKINDPVEQNRIRLYRYFNLSRYIKLYYQNETRNVYLEGYVEKIDTDLFENPQVAQIELLCPTPFFRDMEDSFISFSTVQDNFTFPFGTQDNLGPFEFSILLAEDRKNVYNGGDVGCGIEISIFARDQVINPIIYNAGTGQRFALKFEMKASDEIKIITFKGEKSVTLIRESVRTNIINYMEKDSIWFQLSNADNVFTYDAEQGKNNMLVSFSYNYSFVGV